MNKTFSIGLTAAVLLGACGGGSDSPGNTPANAAFPLVTAYNSYISGPQVYNYGISGTCGGSASETTSPPVAATFQGAPALVKTSTMSMSWANCAALSGMAPGTSTDVSQTFYDSNLRPLGASFPAQGITAVFTGGAAIPATVKVGDSAVVASAPGVSLSYAVEPDTDTSVIVNLTTIILTTTTVNVPGVGATTKVIQTTDISSFRLTAAGGLTLLHHDILMPNNISLVLTPK